MQSKKALSEIISTILILLITIASTTLVISFLIPYLKDRMDKGSECLPYGQGYFQFDDSADSLNCILYNNPNTYLGLSIKTTKEDKDLRDNLKELRLGLTFDSGEGEVDTINFGFQETNSRYIYKSPAGKDDILSPKYGEVTPFVLKFPSEKKYVQVTLYPVLKNGKVCEISDQIQLRTCQGRQATDIQIDASV